MARNGYPEDFDLIDVPGYPGMKMVREAALQLAGACAEFWMETGDKPGILETFRTIATQKHYAATMKPGTFAPVINGIGTSNHGLGLASDMAAPLDSYRNVRWGYWDVIARRWGLNNVQGRATGANGEPWHYVYVGNPQNRATGREMDDMANLNDTLNATRTELTWLRAQQDREAEKLALVLQIVSEGFTRVDWLRDRMDQIVPPTLKMADDVLEPDKPAS
jgi:hypothetical protein